MPHALDLAIDGTAYTCLTFLEASELPPEGPPPCALVARAPKGTPLSRASAETNPAFLAFLHDTLAERGEREPALVTAATKQGQGYLYVLDTRAPASGEVTPEEVIGRFQVEAGAIVPGSYYALATWRPIGAAGPFRLPSWLHALLRAALPRALGDGRTY